MNDYELLGINSAKKEEKKPWGEIATTATTLLITVLGTNVEGFDWILYLSVPILVIAFVLMLYDTKLVDWIKTRIQRRKEERHLSRIADEYHVFIEKFRVVEKLTEKILRLEWSNVPIPRHYHFGNKIIDLSYRLKYCNKAGYSRTIMLNHVLNIYVDIADEFFRDCDYLVVERKVTYKHERDKSEIQKLFRQYDGFRELHDDFCKSINNKLSVNCLSCFHGDTFCYIPKELIAV